MLSDSLLHVLDSGIGRKDSVSGALFQSILLHFSFENLAVSIAIYGR